MEPVTAPLPGRAGGVGVTGEATLLPGGTNSFAVADNFLLTSFALPSSSERPSGVPRSESIVVGTEGSKDEGGWTVGGKGYEAAPGEPPILKEATIGEW